MNWKRLEDCPWDEPPDDNLTLVCKADTTEWSIWRGFTLDDTLKKGYTHFTRLILPVTKC